MTAVNEITNDSTSRHPFDPAQAGHAYSYDVNGHLVTDTATVGTAVWVKSFTYSGDNLVSESEWIYQGKP